MSDERTRAEEFTRRLAAAYGDALVAVLLYGSAARGDYRAGVSDLNLLVILRSADAATLRLGSALAREWATEGNPPPLILGEAEWRASADVFPIEYTDIREAHLVLHGEHPFGGLDIGWGNLRLQCEHELKSKQIRLREHYLLVESGEDVGKLLVQSFPTFLTLFRTALRLAGREVPRAPDEVVGSIAALAGFAPEPFRAVHRARAVDGSAFAPAPDDPIVTGYIDSVRRTTQWLDGLAQGAPTGATA
ncbi:MAG: nucleotidyltransferase domain-containing protein [Gemmatimonadetes bacterium]|nr:nucleotidyltransferase domain-containing protein [Gemmatimonadota bacterium]